MNSMFLIQLIIVFILGGCFSYIITYQDVKITDDKLETISHELDSCRAINLSNVDKELQESTITYGDLICRENHNCYVIEVDRVKFVPNIFKNVTYCRRIYDLNNITEGCE